MPLPSPSPICTVNSASTLNGVDVTASAGVFIALADTAGVKTWSLVCINTDDLHYATTITAALTINDVTKSAAFIAPSGAAALLFRSVVNGGLDGNGNVDPNLTTTFGIYVRSPQNYRVAAFNETTEGSLAFGWVAKFNGLVRNIATMPGNVILCGSSAGPLADGSGVVGIANATTVPTFNPTGGGVLFVHAGALMYLGSSGTLTTIAPA